MPWWAGWRKTFFGWGAETPEKEDNQGELVHRGPNRCAKKQRKMVPVRTESHTAVGREHVRRQRTLRKAMLGEESRKKRLREKRGKKYGRKVGGGDEIGKRFKPKTVKTVQDDKRLCCERKVMKREGKMEKPY